MLEDAQVAEEEQLPLDLEVAAGEPDAQAAVQADVEAEQLAAKALAHSCLNRLGAEEMFRGALAHPSP